MLACIDGFERHRGVTVVCPTHVDELAVSDQLECAVHRHAVYARSEDQVARQANSGESVDYAVGILEQIAIESAAVMAPFGLVPALLELHYPRADHEFVCFVPHGAGGRSDGHDVIALCHLAFPMFEQAASMKLAAWRVD
ncbi:hypothetical protein AWN90_36870 [Nocardia terpenica]|uniref:Uncharacterized protein n=1 Tax=Nocardia terpenica TaxID=455432 RepID=A0A164LCC3_9NOCA|nr:hypothetical protein AWN90_36870 [Nocardia terpenica]